MFPTHVGMNRVGQAVANPSNNMFPTHVGMNRPVTLLPLGQPSCSPHTWG